MSTQSTQERILHNTWNSTCSWRVRLVLAYKELPFKYIPINLQKAEDNDPAYINVNPSGVPTLTEPDGRVFTQSMAIMEYLEEKYPERSILPNEMGRRALCRAIAQEIISGIQPLQNMAVAYLHLQCRGLWKGGPDGRGEKPNIMIGAKQLGPYGEVSNLRYLRDVLVEKLWGVENLMSRVSGTYTVGDTFSIADAALIPQVYASHHSFAVDISVFPTICRVLKTVKELPFVLATSPDECPDFMPPKLPFADVGIPKVGGHKHH